MPGIRFQNMETGIFIINDYLPTGNKPDKVSVTSRSTFEKLYIYSLGKLAETFVFILTRPGRSSFIIFISQALCGGII